MLNLGVSSEYISLTLELVQGTDTELWSQFRVHMPNFGVSSEYISLNLELVQDTYIKLWS